MRSEHLLYRFPRCQLLKNELYGNAGPSNDRFAHHDRWIGLDQFFSHCFYLRMSTATPNTYLDNPNPRFSPCRYLANFTTRNIASMGIRNPHPEMLFDHELVFPSRIRASKTQLTKAANQLCPRCWAKVWHQATSWIASVMPSIEGSGWPIFSPKTIHSSKTSRNSSRQTSSVSACAHTPWRLSIVPK